jgi:hypothetical protein
MTINTAYKIKALYNDRKDIDRRNSLEAQKQTIRLLTFGGIGSAAVYTGTRPEYNNIDGLLVIRPNIKKHVYAVIYVDYSDTYVIDYVQVTRDKAEVIENLDGIYLDSLAECYERVYDDYINTYQEGCFGI